MRFCRLPVPPLNSSNRLDTPVHCGATTRCRIVTNYTEASSSVNLADAVDPANWRPMAVPDLDAAEQDLSENHADTVARHREQRRQMTYRLAVLGPSVADVVRCVGGWLFDRAM